MVMNLGMATMHPDSAPWTGAGEGLPPIRAVTASDADEQAAHLIGWEQRYDQMSAGRFQGALVERRGPGLQVFREYTSESVHQDCCVRPDTFWFGMPLQPGRTRINGRLGGAGSVLVRPGGRQFELVTPEDCQIFGVVVDRALLERHAERLRCPLDWNRLSRQTRFTTPALSLYLALLRGFLQEDRPMPMRAGEVLCHLLSLLDGGQIDLAGRRSLARRRRVVRAACERVLAVPHEPPTVAELCEGLGVSRRTLHNCFETVVGESPVHYMRVLRLNGARRQLRRGDDSVAEVAFQWGFGHPSQFAADYRRLFGERPSLCLHGAGA